MLCYKFDGTPNGMLCCLFESFTRKEMPYIVTSGEIQLTFDSEIRVIETNAKNAERVGAGIKKCGSITLLNRLFYLFRSADASRETVIFTVAHKCLEARRDVTNNYADPAVVVFSDLTHKISQEIHRMKGFIRFEESADGVWYAHFEPDNDVIDLVAPHFAARLGTRFILHDVKRNRVAASDGKQIVTFYPSAPLTVYLSPKEVEMKELWRTYYDSVNVPERKNLKLMRSYMPVRYHKHLPERQPRIKR